MEATLTKECRVQVPPWLVSDRAALLQAANDHSRGRVLCTAPGEWVELLDAQSLVAGAGAGTGAGTSGVGPAGTACTVRVAVLWSCLRVRVGERITMEGCSIGCFSARSGMVNIVPALSGKISPRVRFSAKDAPGLDKVTAWTVSDVYPDPETGRLYCMLTASA